MARPLRIEFADAYYHVTARGNQKATIFSCDDDRREWLAILGQVAERFHWRVYAYCQLGNHYHLLVRTPEPNLARCMRHLNGVYTQRFNRHHRRCGHLLQGRYHAVIVDQQSYLLEVTRYVLLNPVRAGLVSHPDDWPWSSHRNTLNQTPPDWLAAADLLVHFSSERTKALSAFQRFVLAGINAESPWKNLQQDIYLGDESFVAETQMQILEARRSDREIPRPQRLTKATSLQELFSNHTTIADAVITAYQSGRFTMRQIADHLGVHYSTISRLCRTWMCQCCGHMDVQEQLAKIELLDCKTPRIDPSAP